MKTTKSDLESMVNHMFNCAGNMLALCEEVLPKIDYHHYSKGTKQDIKVHLSQDIVRLLELMRPCFTYMQSVYPEHAEKIERWKILDEKIIPAEIERQMNGK